MAKLLRGTKSKHIMGQIRSRLQRRRIVDRNRAVSKPERGDSMHSGLDRPSRRLYDTWIRIVLAAWIILLVSVLSGELGIPMIIQNIVRGDSLELERGNLYASDLPRIRPGVAAVPAIPAGLDLSQSRCTVDLLPITGMCSVQCS